MKHICCCVIASWGVRVDSWPLKQTVLSPFRQLVSKKNKLNFVLCLPGENLQHWWPLLQRGGVQSQQPLPHVPPRLIHTHMVLSREYVRRNIWFVSQLVCILNGCRSVTGEPRLHRWALRKSLGAVVIICLQLRGDRCLYSNFSPPVLMWGQPSLLLHFLTNLAASTESRSNCDQKGSDRIFNSEHKYWISVQKFDTFDTKFSLLNWLVKRFYKDMLIMLSLRIKFILIFRVL